MNKEPNPTEAVSRWWRTSIIEMRPGHISFRGKPIEEIIGNFSFTEMIWFLLRGNRPTPEQNKLLEAALVAGVDHGPQAPSIAAARMAMTCGVGLNNAMATAVNMLGDTHGGAGEQCAELYYDIAKGLDNQSPLEEAVKKGLEEWREKYGKIVSGYGHRFHKPIDPRSPRLLALVDAAQGEDIDKRFTDIGREVERTLASEQGQAIPMNIDGATAVIFCALGFPPPLSRGLFCLSRSVGILAHAWEQKEQGGRNKGPVPPQYLPLYEGKHE